MQTAACVFKSAVEDHTLRKLGRTREEGVVVHAAEISCKEVDRKCICFRWERGTHARRHDVDG